MACCMKNKYGSWCEDLETYDIEGSKYCVFHAPKGSKKMEIDGTLKLLSLAEFNFVLLERIINARNVTTVEQNTKCNLSGTIFEGDILFIEAAISFKFHFGHDDPLPPIIFNNAIFSGQTVFSTTFGGDVSFANAIFYGKADFGGAKFIRKADFRNAEFNSEVCFWNVQFNEVANFTNVRFDDDVDFSAIKCNRMVFNKTVFKGKTDFINSNFGEEGNFNISAVGNKIDSIKAFCRPVLNINETTFNNELEFVNNNFFGKVEFNETILGGNVQFINSTFKGDLCFDKSRFDKNITLVNISVSGKVCFINNTSINGNASFINPIFSGPADFSTSVFGGKTDLKNARFLETADLSSSTFGKETTFTDTVFSKHADFKNSTFDGSAKFLNTKFQNTALFLNTYFNCGVTFRALFGDKSSFQGAVIRDYSVFLGSTFIATADFTSVYCEKSVRFEGVSLEGVSFQGTDIRNLGLTNCTWIKRNGDSILYDEHMLFCKYSPLILTMRNPLNIARLMLPTIDIFPKIDSTDAGKVEILYRMLKQRAKEDHDEVSASNWHYREKQMFRLGNSWRRYVPGASLTWLYWICSGYGERPIRAFVALLIVWISLSAIFLVTGLTLSETRSDILYGMDKHQIEAGISYFNMGPSMLNTFKLATLQKDAFLSPIGWKSEIVKILAQIILPIQAALFAFAVRNRFRR